MSLILKGIDMPKEGEWLEVIIKPTKEVIVDTIRYRDNALLKTEYESAIQIPRGHGRLIDADKFIEDLKYDVEMARTRYITDGDEEAREDAECKENCISFIESSATPKILEAEENDESNTERD